MATDARSKFFVLLFGVANAVEFVQSGENAASEPHSIALKIVRDDIHFNGLGFDTSLTQFFTSFNTLVDHSFHVSLDAFVDAFEQSGTSRKDNILVEPTTNIDR